MNNLQFPKSFKFGVADADLQVIGEKNTLTYENSTPTMWTHFAKKGNTYQSHSPLEGIDRYHLWGQDIDLMVSLGIKHYRTSISMARILHKDKTVNKKAIEWYRTYFTALNKRGISIYATLYHWELPQFLSAQGGWKNKATIDYLIKHAEAVYRNLNDYIDEYFILNEPWCSTFFSYHTGDHAPGEKDLKGTLESAHNLLLAQGMVYRTLRELDSSIKISTVYNPVTSYSLTSAEKDLDARRYSFGYYTTWLTDPLFTGKYPDDMMKLFEPYMPTMHPRDMETMHIGKYLYSFGVNYYYSSLVKFNKHRDVKFKEAMNPNSILNGLGWPTFIPPIYPDGFYDLLTTLHTLYEPHGLRRMYITENGTCWNSEPDANGSVRDDFRIFYISHHLRQVYNALLAGVPIQGYFLWTLMDNYEWQFGYTPESCFGIVHIDRKTMKRTPKKSFYWYKDIVSTHNLALPVHSYQ